MTNKEIRYAASKAVVLAAKDKPCVDCGLQFPPCAMDFDHVRGEKKFGIGAYGGHTPEKLLEEIAKCDVVCANCHRVRTHAMRLKQGWSKRPRPKRKVSKI